LKSSLIQTSDGSYTIYSKKYSQNFHNTKDGALSESLYKHIIPSFVYHKNKKTLNILDICFGLGYNSLATIYYIIKSDLDISVNIYSPELDIKLIRSLKDFIYPKEFDIFKDMITQLSQNLKYKDKRCSITIYNQDAREYIANCDIKFDIVYQDPFSSDVNHSLWTKEYFSLIKNILNDDAIITTYAISTPIRLSLYSNNLYIYEYKSQQTLKQTIAFTKKQTNLPKEYKYIDMELKKQRNPLAKPLLDILT
jgi:tRNA U34 5-methylaminomethyl-2-thiouridine-forming methyltransferase MnmC